MKEGAGLESGGQTSLPCFLATRRRLAALHSRYKWVERAIRIRRYIYILETTTTDDDHMFVLTVW